MYPCRLVLTAVLAGLFIAPAASQPAPIKWGNVPEEHLMMTSFPADTNAKAVILADYGTVQFERDWSYKFTRHRRIKILSEGGYDWGTFSIPYDSDDGYQAVSDVKGQTIKLGPGGKAIVEKMDKKSIFNEKLEGTWKRVRFTLPALESGVVIEYTYTLYTKYPTFLPTWEFQSNEPTLWSEFSPEIPGFLGYGVYTRGYFDRTEEKVRSSTVGDATKIRMVMRDVPALRDEPFMTTADDYRAQVRHQLSAFKDQGMGVTRVLHDWNTVASELMDHDSFGGKLEPGRAVRQQAEQIVAGISDPAEKMEAIYDFVRTTVRWNGDDGFFLGQELEDVLRSRSGDLAEVNLLLVSLLRGAGLDADPVLISTRSNGRVIEMYPMLTQFDAVLAHVNIGGKPYLMDATEPLRPHSILPARALNGRGFLLRDKAGTWIDIEATGRARHQTLVIATLDSIGGLAGTIETSGAEYAGLAMRFGRKEKDDDARWVKEVMLENLADVEVDSFRIENGHDVKQPLRVAASFRLPTYAQAMGDMIYLTPQLLDRVQENPFRLEERTFPVDMTYPKEVVYSLSLTLPQGYTVQEAPKGKRIALESNGAMFQRKVEVRDGVLSMMTRFVISKPLFMPKQYQELKSFYDAVVAAEAEQVVLKRDTDGAAGIQPASVGN